ncbi:MAG: transcriptional regulator [Gammaproteobacteria bacterium]|nr:MAG: transcriptional regulator [Gammaproteobacteria bacterium]
MSKKKVKIFPRERKILESLGERLMLARKRRKMTTETVAARAGITRVTLSRAEKGSPEVSIGIYFRILSVLHLEEDIHKLASDDKLGRSLQDMELK